MSHSKQPILSRTLSEVVRKKWTSARELADLAGVSTSTVYRWIAGESQPDFDSVRLLLRHLPNRNAQEAVLGAFCSGSGWSFSFQEGDLDINHDGKIDAEDALDAAIQTVQHAASALKQTRSAAREDKLDAEQALQLIQTLNLTTRHCAVVQQVLIAVAEEQGKRKKLRLAK